MMMFPCFPPKSDLPNGQKCEWNSGIRDFVVQLNAETGKRYSLSECLDLKSKGPEVLLEAPDGDPIVIERKSIVWPKHHLRDHAKEHLLFDLVCKPLNGLFQDELYQLKVVEQSLKGKSEREVKEIASQIVAIVRLNPKAAKSQRGVGHQEPIPWRFSLFHGQDENAPKVGVGLSVEAKFWSADTHGEILKEIAVAKSGYIKELEHQAIKASEKFAKYDHCQKLLVIQFFGDTLALRDEDITAVVQSAQLPQSIDQVWVAKQDMTGDDCIIRWRHIRVE